MLIDKQFSFYTDNLPFYVFATNLSHANTGCFSFPRYDSVVHTVIKSVGA